MNHRQQPKYNTTTTTPSHDGVVGGGVTDVGVGKSVRSTATIIMDGAWRFMGSSRRLVKMGIHLASCTSAVGEPSITKITTGLDAGAVAEIFGLAGLAQSASQ